MIRIEVDNRSRKIIADFGKLDKEFRSAVRHGLIRNGAELNMLLRAGIKNPPKSGIKYRNLPNRSSAPGEYPAKQTGNLGDSVKSTVSGLTMKLGYSKRANYGRYLELGTKGRMAPRPAILRTINENVYRVRHNFITELSKRFKR